MRREGAHASDEELLRAADRELAPAEAARVQEHLRGCEACRERAERMSAWMADFAKAYREAGEAGSAAHAAARARLKARLAESQRPREPLVFWGLSWRGWASACAVIVLAGLGARLAYDRAHLREARETAAADGGPLVPDARLTPGAVRALSLSQACASGGPAENRPPAALQQAVFHEYGMDGAAPDGYEVDHLITPALGGSDDIRNLWPEPYSPEWNAHVKDQLEDYLHEQVCSGRMDLPTAQHEIATNWITAYQKYFHTEKPLRRNSAAIADKGDFGG